MAETVVYTQPRGGGTPIEEFPATINRYSYRHNRPGSVDVSLPLHHPKTVRDHISEGDHELVVVRNKSVVWTGPVLITDEQDDPGELIVQGEGLMSYLRRMRITSTLTFAAGVDDQFDIGRALISHHQSKTGGNFGIDTTSVSTSGRTRDRTYHGYELKNVFTALIQLAEVDDGFDLNINPDTRSLDLYYPRRGQRRTDIVFDERNIRKFRRRRDYTRQTSEMWGVGSGEGDDMLTATLQDSTALSRYGLTQDAVTHKDVTEPDTLIGHTAAALTASSSIPNLISVTVSTDDPQLGSYGIGDEVKVRWPSTYDPVDEFQRIIGIDVHPPNGETHPEEQAVLHLETL